MEDRVKDEPVGDKVKEEVKEKIGKDKKIMKMKKKKNRNQSDWISDIIFNYILQLSFHKRWKFASYSLFCFLFLVKQLITV